MKEVKISKTDKVALVDDEDYKLVSQYTWHLATAGRSDKVLYARAHDEFVDKKSKSIFMHKLITKTDRHTRIDHKDRNGLNNQKYNLRIATSSQNSANRIKTTSKTKYKGVKINESHIIGISFLAYIGFQKKTIYLGAFSTEEAAAGAYNRAATKLFGEFALLNDVNCPNFEQFRLRKPGQSTENGKGFILLMDE